MSVEVRPIDAGDMRRFVYNDQVGFGLSTADTSIDAVLALDFVRPEQTLCVFEDGEPVAQMATLPLRIRWNGRDLPCGGLTAVSTMPSHRRRGHLRRLMTRALADMRDRGQPLAMLWASMAAIYQRFGYGVGAIAMSTNFDPRSLRFVDAVAAPGRTRMVPVADAIPVLRPVYEAWMAGRTLAVHRDDVRWQRAVLRSWPPGSPPLLVCVYEEHGEALGYAVYAVVQPPAHGPEPSQHLRATLAWRSPAAYRALIGHLAGYDLAASVSTHRLPEDDPLFLLVEEPRLLNATARDGVLVRIVDLVPALEGRGYDGDGAVTFAVADDLCPWNSGTWRLEAAGGSARVTASAGEAAVTLTPRALAMVATGVRPASVLARAGVISSGDGRALTALDAIFHTAQAPACFDTF